MIQANELRVGNLVYLDGIVTKVNWNMLGFEKTPLDPILLTTNWILNFGFFVDEINEGDTPTFRSDLYPNFYIDFKTLQPIDGGFNIANYKLKYVHQLQNLFFAITGNELIISK